MVEISGEDKDQTVVAGELREHVLQQISMIKNVDVLWLQDRFSRFGDSSYGHKVGRFA